MTLFLFLLYFPLQLPPGDAWPQSNEGGSREPGPQNDLRAPATYKRKTVVRPNGDLGAGGKRNAFKGNTRRNSHQHGGKCWCVGYKWGKRILFKVDAGKWRDSRRASISSSFSKVSSKERGGGLFRKRRGGIQCLETTCLNSRIESYGNSRQVFVESILVLSLVMVSHIFVPYFPEKTAIIFRAQAGGRLLKRGGEIPLRRRRLEKSGSKFS